MSQIPNFDLSQQQYYAAKYSFAYFDVHVEEGVCGLSTIRLTNRGDWTTVTHRFRHLIGQLSSG